jgi:NitT/TauT family transport system ATP-binding protein
MSVQSSAEPQCGATAEPRCHPAAPAVDLSRISVRFTTEHGTITAIDNLDLSVRQGGFLTILGPSGCGKSTLLRVMADLIVPSTGAVRVMNEPPAAARRRREIGFVFQHPALLAWRTVLGNVQLPLEVGGRPIVGRRTPQDLLRLVGLEGWENAYPHQLSGGMRQRVSIARALINEPKLLLMDEPFGALDEITRDRLNEELLNVWQETGTTIVFVSHSIYEAAFLSESVILLAARPGRIVERVPVPFPYPRTPVLRRSAEFNELLGTLREVLGTC